MLKTWGGHRERVSATAALTISPRRCRLGLYFRTYPKNFVNQSAQRISSATCWSTCAGR